LHAGEFYIVPDQPVPEFMTLYWRRACLADGVIGDSKRKFWVTPREPRILYIEDYQYLGILFQKVMAQLDYQIDLATSGQEGLGKFFDNPYDVVVLDYHLPDMTGIDIARKLLESESEVAVVLVTGHGDEDIASKALNLGVSDYLVKDDQNVFLTKLPDAVIGLLKEQEKQRQKEEQRQALRESEARYRALVESSLQGIMVHMDFHPVFANQAYARMHGYETAAEICELDSILNLLPAEEHKAWLAASATISDSETETYDYSHRGVRKDGTPVWLDIRGQQIQWEGSPAIQIVAVDTTARREAQLELEKREARFRALANMSSDWFWECDADFQVTTVDGSQDTETLRQGLDLLLSPIGDAPNGHDADVLVQMRDLLASHKPIRNMELRTPFSPFFWISVSADPLISEDGAFVGYDGTAQNIEGRKQAEQNLRDNEEQLQAIQENLPAALIIKDEHGRFTYVNRNFRTRHNFPESGLIGKTSADLFDAETADKLNKHDQTLLQSGEVSSEEIEMTRPDGGSLHVNNIKFPVGLGEKRLIGTISLDITEQKQAFLDLQRSEKLLQESENYLRELVQSANAPIISLDHEFNIVDWNRAAEEITGFSKDEVLSSNFVDRVVTGHMRDQVRTMLEDSGENRQNRNAKISLQTRTGKAATVLFSTTARRGEDGLVSDIVCIGQDITQLIQAQDELTQSQKMEAIGQLTGGIAHDFNNLLQIVSGATTMLDELQSKENDLTRWITQIDEAVERGASLTTQLLAFSRQQNLSPSVVRPNKVVSEIEMLLQRTLGEDIQWNILVSGVTPPVLVDDHALQNAIINLCVNSRAAMRDGGELTIRVAEVEITAEEVAEDDVVKPGAFVEVSVSDNGEGMTPEILENAINPFFSTKSVGEGTGLGLSMVYGFSRQSGGLTRIESELGVGTKVSILLPVTDLPLEGVEAPEMTLEDQPETPVPPRGAGAVTGPILVVEDNEDVRDSTCAMLQVSGYDYVEADNGKNALKILALRPDINTIFSDVVMPGGMSGFDLARELGESGRKYNVLLTSGYPDKLNQGSSIVDHSIQMIAKPFTIKELETALGNLLGN